MSIIDMFVGPLSGFLTIAILGFFLWAVFPSSGIIKQFLERRKFDTQSSTIIEILFYGGLTYLLANCVYYLKFHPNLSANYLITFIAILLTIIWVIFLVIIKFLKDFDEVIQTLVAMFAATIALYLILIFGIQLLVGIIPLPESPVSAQVVWDNCATGAGTLNLINRLDVPIMIYGYSSSTQSTPYNPTEFISPKDTKSLPITGLSPNEDLYIQTDVGVVYLTSICGQHIGTLSVPPK